MLSKVKGTDEVAPCPPVSVTWMPAGLNTGGLRALDVGSEEWTGFMGW